MSPAVREELSIQRQRGFWLRCFLGATLLPVFLIGSGGASKLYAACPVLPEMKVSHLQGTVYGPSGVAISQILVQVEHDGKVVSQVQTDEKGRFGFRAARASYVVHFQFLGSRSMDLKVQVGRGRGFHSGRLFVILGLSGTRCDFVTGNKNQFKNEIRRYNQRLVEEPPGP